MKPALRITLLHALFGWLNLSLTAPSIYLWLGLPLIMRQHGWSGMDIGLFQLAGLPALFKFALALPVECRRGAADASTQRYRPWAIALCLLLAAVMLLMGRRELLHSRNELFALACAVALLTTWADIPVNALAIRVLPEAQRLRAGGIRSAALSLGAIVGGGIMLLLQTRWGWRAPFWLMAAGIGMGAAGLLLLGKTARTAHAGDATAHRGADWRGYFAQPAAPRWNALLLLCFPFIGSAWFYLKPLLLDHGFAAQQVALIAGVGGGSVAALASLLAVRVTRRIGVAKALPAVTLLSLLALLALALAVLLRPPPAGFIAAALLVALAMGAAASLAFGLMMYFARPGHSAADYGVQASLFAAGRLLVPLAAGALLDQIGYGGMLLALAVAMAGVTVLAFDSRALIARQAAH